MSGPGDTVTERTRKGCRITVEIDLDGVPGWGDDAEDFRRLVERSLMDQVPHYRPVVTVADQEIRRAQ